MGGISVKTWIDAPPERVFEVATDLPRASERIQAIQKIEMLTPGEVGEGTRWRETRKIFGKEATEEMWITGFEPPRFYTVGAESHGSRYRTGFTFEPKDGGTELTMSFEAEPVTITAKILGILTKPMMKSLAKMCAKDLEDIKNYLEGTARAGQAGAEE